MISQKLAKRVRRLIRRLDRVLPKVVYQEGPKGLHAVPNWAAGLNLDGTPKVHYVYTTGTVVVAAGCQRRHYLDMKAALSWPALNPAP